MSSSPLPTTHADWQHRSAALSLDGAAYIDGHRYMTRQGESLASINPMTGTSLADITACGPEDIDVAVDAARRAFELGAWSRAEPTTRRRCLQALAAQVRDHAEELALLDSLEVGKREATLLCGGETLQAGTVTVNGVDAVSPQTPFGGMKQSGIGRDYALAGMHKYMALKTRWIHY